MSEPKHKPKDNQAVIDYLSGFLHLTREEFFAILNEAEAPVYDDEDGDEDDESEAA